jgi:HEAT repeat protein
MGVLSSLALIVSVVWPIVCSAADATYVERPLDDLLLDLYSKDPNRRYDAAAAFAQHPKLAREAVQALATALSDEDSRVRSFAASSLSKIGVAARPARKALEQRLKDESPCVRVYAARALVSIGHRSEELKESLAGLMANDDSHIQAVAAAAGMECNMPGSLQALVRCLPSEPGMAGAALRKAGSWATEVVPVLLALLDKHRELRGSEIHFAIIRFLGDLGPPAKGALPLLKAILAEAGAQSEQGILAERISEERLLIRQAIMRIENEEAKPPGSEAKSASGDGADRPRTVQEREGPDN